MNRVKVYRGKNVNRIGERNWIVEDQTERFHVRTFVFETFRSAIKNAHRIARGEKISPTKLRGYQRVQKKRF